jgi:hypothetical protein
VRGSRAADSGGSAALRQDFLDLLTATDRGEIVTIPVLLRRLIRVADGLARMVRLPASAVLKTLRLRSPAD